MKGLSVIIPAFNEEGRIGETVGAAWCLPGAVEVIVVDDGSADQTAARAHAAGATVVRHPRNRGKGHSLGAGAERARGDLLVFLDADTGASAVWMAHVMAPVARGEVDMAIAHFPRTTAGAGARKNGFGLARGIAAWGVRHLTGLALESPLSGQRVLTRAVWQVVSGRLPGDFGFEVALTVAAARARFRIVEVGVPMRHRVTRLDARGVWHRARQFSQIGRALAASALAPQPRTVMPAEHATSPDQVLEPAPGRPDP